MLSVHFIVEVIIRQAKPDPRDFEALSPRFVFGLNMSIAIVPCDSFVKKNAKSRLRVTMTVQFALGPKTFITFKFFD